MGQLNYLPCKEAVGEEETEDLGGAGRRKKMRTTFTGKQVGVFIDVF